MLITTTTTTTTTGTITAATVLQIGSDEIPQIPIQHIIDLCSIVQYI